MILCKSQVSLLVCEAGGECRSCTLEVSTPKAEAISVTCSRSAGYTVFLVAIGWQSSGLLAGEGLRCRPGEGLSLRAVSAARALEGELRQLCCGRQRQPGSRLPRSCDGVEPQEPSPTCPQRRQELVGNTDQRVQCSPPLTASPPLNAHTDTPAPFTLGIVQNKTQTSRKVSEQPGCPGTARSATPRRRLQPSAWPGSDCLRPAAPPSESRGHGVQALEF